MNTEHLSNEEICSLLYELEKDDSGKLNVIEVANAWSEMHEAGMTKEEVLVHKDESTTFSLVSLEQKTPEELSTIFGEEKANLIIKIVDIFN
jgi:hypothetical protein